MAKKKPKTRQSTANISMPASMRKYVATRVGEGAFGTVSEYVRHLVRLERANTAPSWLEEMVRRGAQGPFEVADDGWWAQRESKLQRTAQSARPARRKSA